MQKLALVIVGPLLALATTQAMRAGDGIRTSTQYMVFVDWSPSITDAQRIAWTGTATLLVKTLKPGDAVAIYPVHSNTFGARSLFDGESVTIDSNLGIDQLLAARKAFARLRTGVRDALRLALTKPEPTRETDLFGAVDRFLSRKGGRRIVVVLFSDMLQSTRRELDMEHMKMTEKEIPEMIRRVAQAHRWYSGMLNGVTVDCILPGLEGLRSQRDTKVLQLFWESLFRTLGARLERWDTQL